MGNRNGYVLMCSRHSRSLVIGRESRSLEYELVTASLMAIGSQRWTLSRPAG